jgi:hypothetical protein
MQFYYASFESSWLKSTYKIQPFRSKDDHGTIEEKEEKPFCKLVSFQYKLEY